MCVRIKIHAFNFMDPPVVPSENYGGSKLVLIDGYGPRTVALDIVLLIKLASILFICSLFPFPVSTAQFIGEFWNNRRSAMSNLANNMKKAGPWQMFHS
jgi:hypothetical protein